MLRPMQLRAFRIQNYKRIEDTGWVDSRDLTVLVGKNESGKSAVLRALSKMKPSDGAEYDGLREFPRRRYTDEFAQDDWPVSSVRLELTKAEREELIEVAPHLDKVELVEVTRRYSGQRSVAFLGATPAPAVTTRVLRAALAAAKDTVGKVVAPDGKGEQMRELKVAVIAVLDGLIPASSPPGRVTADSVDKCVAAVRGQLNEAWQSEALSGVVIALEALADQAADVAAEQDARTWVVEQMPQYIYFDRFDVLDSAVHIPTFIGKVKNQPHEPRIRTTQCLFDHVQLDTAKLSALIPQPGATVSDQTRRQVDERAILASSAGQAMTKKFSQWWDQRSHSFRYDIDGEYFRVWVADDLDPSEIELDQRSQGMQYFFSFFLVFLVELQAAHVNSVLLLDEPGTSLHGTAQARIVQFLTELSTDNQVIYTTHSPFMIDGDRLENARAVWEDQTTGSTKISDDVWPRDRDALFPLQAALGYRLAQSLFIAPHQILVEGITDYWIIKALAQACASTGRTALHPDIILTPAGGAGRTVPLASMLVGHDIAVAALLDGDDSGRKEGRRLADRVIGISNRVVFIGDYTSHPDGEIEDLFPADYYGRAVAAGHNTRERKPNRDEAAMSSNVDRYTAVLARTGAVEFTKWKVAAALRDQVLADPAAVPDQTLDLAARIFGQFNTLFGFADRQ